MGVRARRVVVCVAGVVMASALGCTSGQQKSAPGEKVADVGAQARAKVAAERVAWVDALAERVAQRRDRDWKRPPEFVARDVAALEPPAPAWSPEVAQEAALLSEAFLGAEAAYGASPRERLAHVDEVTGDVVYAARAPREALSPALAAALTDALLRQYYPAAEAPASWDAWLTGQVVRDGDAAVGGLLESLGTTADVAADRPDLLERSADVRSWALASGEPGSSSHAFTHRVGFSFVTSLYRSQGWNGVEMMRMSGPTTTTSAARHGEWMNGQGAPRWTWPATLDEGMARQGLEPARSGRVGAAMIAAVVEANGAPPEALSLSMAMRADHYVAYEKSGERVVVWASLWETPSLAAQAKGELERRLAAVAAPGRRVRVWRDGLELVVAVALGAPAAPLELAERALEATVDFPPRDGFALPYVSSSTERALLGRELGAYDEETARWSEPTLGVAMDLGALGDGWKVDLNARGLLRWFARRDAELVQMSVELRDPLAGGPAFDAPEYAAGLGQAMGEAIAGAEVEVTRATYPFGQVIEVAVDGEAERMRVAHFARGTILFTYSVRGPAEGFDALWAGAQGALATLEGLSAARSGEPEGTLEYTIEE